MKRFALSPGANVMINFAKAQTAPAHNVTRIKVDSVSWPV